MSDVCKCSNPECNRLHFEPEQKHLKLRLDLDTLLKELSDYRDALVQAIKRPIGAWDVQLIDDGGLSVTVRKDGRFKVIRIEASGRIYVYSHEGMDYQG